MTHKTYFRKKKNQCQKLLNLDRIEKRPVFSKKTKMEFQYLQSFNEHIFSASETLIVNLIKLNIAHYNKFKTQCKLIESKDCATLKQEFMLILKKFRIDQIAYPNLQKSDSFKIMANQSLETFDKFIHQTFSILKKILDECNDDAHQLANSFTTNNPIILYNKSICSEIRNYAIALQYHFTHIDFEIKTDKIFNEKLNNITIDVQSFHDKAMAKYIYQNAAFNDKLKSESLIYYKENVEPNNVPVKDKNTNIEISSKYKHNEHVDYMIKDKNFIESPNAMLSNLKKHHDNAIVSSNDTYFLQFLSLLLLIIAFLGGFYFVYDRFFKRKTIKPSIEHVIISRDSIIS